MWKKKVRWCIGLPFPRRMGLSEPRRKQRLVGAAAHRNAAWTNDMSLPGQRMMSMMGWAPGEGLGTTNKGLSTNLTVSMKLDNKGIGAHRHEREAREQGKSDAWVGAGGDLGSLFDRLNQANEQATPSPPPEPRPSSSRLAHRAKFRRAKQLHGQSAANLNEIFGISASAQASTESQPGKDKQDDKEKEDKAKRKEEKAKRKEDKAQRKEDKAKRKEDKAKRKKDKARSKDPSSKKRKRDEEDESPPLVIRTNEQYVFQYLSNKLLRKKAEVARRKREQGIWWSGAA